MAAKKAIWVKTEFFLTVRGKCIQNGKRKTLFKNVCDTDLSEMKGMTGQRKG